MAIHLRLKPWLFKAARMILEVILGVILLLAVLLVVFQDRLIYHPRGYAMNPERLLPQGAMALHYRADCGRQTAFYLPSSADPPEERGKSAPPKRLWVCFNGNFSLALDFLDLLERKPDPGAGYLLLDYPGYAGCEGKPTPASILESSEKALAALAVELKTDLPALTRHLNVLGYSLGAAAALQLAARHTVERVVLISPFTSMTEMARRTVGWPMCLMLRHRFDNRARLAELARRSPRPKVTIIHGTADSLIPITMSRDLAGLIPGWVVLREIPRVDHPMIIFMGEAEILKALAP